MIGTLENVHQLLARLLPKQRNIPEGEYNSSFALVSALGTVTTSSLVHEAENLWDRIKDSRSIPGDESCQDLITLIMRAKVEYPGNSYEEVFFDLFLSLRSFMPTRHHPFVNALFDAAVRSAQAVEAHKEYEKRLKRITSSRRKS